MGLKAIYGRGRTPAGWVFGVNGVRPPEFRFRTARDYGGSVAAAAHPLVLIVALPQIRSKRAEVFQDGG